MLIDLTSQPASRQLRWFAGLWFPAFAAIAGMSAHRRGALGVAYALWTAAAALGAAGVVRPAIIRPVYIALVRLTLPIGWIVSHAILLVLYFLVITPIGWLVRRWHDPLERAFDREATSYWTPREQPAPTRYFRQF
jgi:hypothetical protein